MVFSRHSLRAFLVVTAMAGLLLPVTGARAGGAGAAGVLQPLMTAMVPSTNVVYVLGHSGCETSSCLRLVRTNDALSGYTTVTLPPVVSAQGNPSGSLGQMIFANTRDGYAVDEVKGESRLYVTHDGARSWHSKLLPRGLVIRDLAVSAPDVYVVTVRCANQGDGASSCSDYELFHSDLAASHWTVTHIPDGNFSTWGYLGRPAVRGDKVWFSAQLHDPILISSLNAGKSFESHGAAKLQSTVGCALTATSGMSLWAECPTGMFVSLFFSGDAGRSWKPLVSPNNQEFSGTGGGAFEPVSGDIAYIDFGDTVSGPNVSRVFGGARESIAVGRLSCPAVVSLVFTNKDNGLAICSDYPGAYFERSTDGGVHWRRLTLR